MAIFDFIDEDGHQIRMDDEGNVTLKLKGGHIEKNIGVVTYGAYIKNFKANHILKVRDAFGFSFDAIRLTNPNSIIAVYEGEDYYITRDVFERKKFFYHFQKKGYERQVFVERKHFARNRKDLPEPPQEEEVFQGKLF